MDANEQQCGTNQDDRATGEIVPKRARGRPPGAQARATRLRAICDTLVRRIEEDSVSTSREAALRCKHLSAALVTLLPYVDRPTARNGNGDKSRPINVLGMGE